MCIRDSLPVALDCLKDKDNERPSAYQLCERVAHLKEISKYSDSIRSTQHKNEMIQSLTSSNKEKDLTLSSKEEENQLLREQLQPHLSEKDQTLEALEERERQLRRVNQQLETSEQVVAQFERRIAKLEQQLSQRDKPNLEASSRGKELASIKLRWREGKRAPCGMSRWCDAVVDGSTVYVRNRNNKIYSYDVTSGVWSQLPDCINKKCPIVVINGWLTTVGGEISDELFSLTGAGSGRTVSYTHLTLPTIYSV